MGDHPLATEFFDSPCGHHVGLAHTVVEPEEGLAIGVEARDLLVDVVKREVVAALAVFGLVVDGAADRPRPRRC